jgi:threonine/homoserine/homoserine lactone efflux protein
LRYLGYIVSGSVLLIGFALGLQHFLQRSAVAAVLAVAGGSVLLWMGYGLVTGALRGSVAADLAGDETGRMSDHPLGAVAHGAVVSLSNPYWTLWWATIGVKLAADGLAIGAVGVLAFFAGHQLADVSWYGFVISVVHRGKGLLTPRVYCTVMGVLGAVLLYMGVRFVGQGVGFHVPWLPF